MPEYRRTQIGGASYFFTVVTYARRPILTTPTARRILRAAWLDVQTRFPFEVNAVCLLPDHLHCIWTMPEEDANYSIRWKEIKRLFTKGFLQVIGPGEPRNDSRKKRNEAAIWQRRFWDHMIRDEKDLERHIEYIHYNPVKHGFVSRPWDWAWSSFHRYVRMGYYTPDWGGSIDGGGKTMICGE